MISIDQQADSVFVWVVSDKTKTIRRKLLIELIDFEGKNLWEEKLDIEIPANSSQAYFTFLIPEKLNTFNPQTTLLRCALDDNSGDKTDRLHYFSKMSELQLKSPNIKKNITEITSGYQIILETDKLAKNIYLEFPGKSGHFSDNYFDLIAGTTKKLTYTTKEKFKNPNDLLKIKSLVDTY